MSKEARTLSRLDGTERVVDVTVVAYEQPTFFGRHPSARFWVFGLSPAIAMLVVFGVACLGIAALNGLCQRCGIRLADPNHLGGVNQAALDWAVSLLTTIVPATGLAFLYCRSARRLSIGKGWMLASCYVLAFVAMLPTQRIAISDIPGKSLWTIGMMLPPGAMQCVQLLVPLAAGLWFALRPDQPTAQEDAMKAPSSLAA